MSTQSNAGLDPAAACSRCGVAGGRWDLLADHVVCPDCQEALVTDQAEALQLPPGPDVCRVCGKPGTAALTTWPMPSQLRPLVIDLCPFHLRAVLARQLPAWEFRLLARWLAGRGLRPHHVFLLCEAFYDADGQALDPARTTGGHP